jgi:hypothetical protein
MIVPSGIATDSFTQQFFADIVDRASLVALYDFENRKKLFEAVDSRMKFSILVLAGSARQDARFRAGFFLLDPAEIHEPDKTFLLGADDIALLNPNTRTCPIFRGAGDAELTKDIYRRVPVLVDESKGKEGNPWGVRFKLMFMMNTASHLFRTQEELRLKGADLGHDGRFRKDDTVWLPLYEAKLIHQYDHRFATFEGGAKDDRARDTTLAEHQDPSYVVTPRYWVEECEVEKATDAPANRHPGWFFGFRDIARATDERTGIFSLVPWAAIGNPLPLLLIEPVFPTDHVAALIANVSAFVFDYPTRQKTGGTHLNFFIVKQLPVLPPDVYTKALLDLIVPRVLELTYTAHDMAPFARDLGYDGPPFIWDEERRAQLRADLDGIYAHLYGVSRDDFAYILDTFPIVARNDMQKYGEYRTRHLCLEAWDHFAPETLRQLELQVRKIEQDLRSLIVRVLNNDPDNLPADIKTALIEERIKHRPNGATEDVPALRELLESSYLPQLDKIVRSDVAWPAVDERFGSRSQFKNHFGRLTTFRNPLAHGRSVSEEVRQKGEEAIAWFRSALDGETSE